MELALLEWLAAHRVPALTSVMLSLTEVGRAGTIWVLAGLARAAVHRRLAMAACQLIIAVTLAGLAPDYVLKPLTGRPRPFVPSPALAVTSERDRLPDYSFPSGHASMSVAGAYALTAMWPAGRVLCWTLAGGILASRAYLGVHYPSDLLGGAALGLFIGWFVVGGTTWSGSREDGRSVGRTGSKSGRREISRLAD
jgi:undecaprenyl-diphosphatase